MLGEDRGRMVGKPMVWAGCHVRGRAMELQ